MKLLCGPDKKRAKKGFTLTELAIVIAVIAILIAVLVPTFSSIINKAKASNELVACNNEWTNYYIDANIAAEGTENDYLVVYTGNEYTNSGNTYYHGYLAEKGSLDTETQLDLTVTDSAIALYNNEYYAAIDSYEYMAEGKIVILTNGTTESFEKTISIPTTYTYGNTNYTVDNSGLTYSGSGTTVCVTGTLKTNESTALYLWKNATEKGDYVEGTDYPRSLFTVIITLVNQADSGSCTLKGDETKTLALPSDGVYELTLNGDTEVFTFEYPTADGGSTTVTIYNNAIYNMLIPT